jgi:hypothetical protein
LLFHAKNKDKFTKLDSATYKSWGQRVHVDIDTKKRNTTQEKMCRDTKIFNRYCEGEGCKSKKRADRNIVNVKGEECHACYTLDLTGHLPNPTYFDSQSASRFVL